GGVRVFDEDRRDRRIGGLHALLWGLLGNPADRVAGPDQVVPFGVDQIDGEGALGVIVDPGLVVPNRHGEVAAGSIAVVVLHVRARHVVDVGALADDALEVHPQVGIVRVEAVAAGVHFATHAGLDPVGQIRGVA